MVNVNMKTVRLLVRKGTNDAGTYVEYDDASAAWMVANGYAVEVPSRNVPEPSGDTTEAPAAPKRGRPRKTETS